MVADLTQAFVCTPRLVLMSVISSNILVEFWMPAPYVMNGNPNTVQRVRSSLIQLLRGVQTDFDAMKTLGDTLEKMRAILDTSKSPVKDPNPGFLLVVLPQNAAVPRKEVKQWSDMQTGIPTQCVVCRSSPARWRHHDSPATVL